MGKNGRRRLRIVDRDDDERHRDVEEMTPAERLAIMWQLTLDAWAFKDGGQLTRSNLPDPDARQPSGDVEPTPVPTRIASSWGE